MSYLEAMSRISELTQKFQVAAPAVMTQAQATAPAAATTAPQTFQTKLADAQKISAANVSTPTSTTTAGAAAPANVEAMLQASAKKYGVDPNLVRAVARAESGFAQSAGSHAGAIGTMQLMPGTAKSLGVDPYDQAQNIDGGTKYLKQMLDQFGGDVPKALAGYNAGPGAVQKYGGVPPYGETQAYVKKIVAELGL